MSQHNAIIFYFVEVKMKIIDLSFNITGKQIPADHGYSLYSCISHILPHLHNSNEIGIHTISGIPIGNRLISITPQSRLIFRVDDEKIQNILPVAGKTIEIDRNKITIGVSSTLPIVPYPRLYSRIVIIKGFTEPEPFLEAAKRQLEALGIKGKAALVPQPEIAEANIGRESGTHSPFLRRTINIHGKQVVGFALKVGELSAEESITLQEKGIGGRRHFGCGIFIPDRR